jgi:hypothetical protein
MKTMKESLNDLSITIGRLVGVKHFMSVVLVMIFILVYSCSKDSEDPNVIFKATMNGASETPANASTATGTATLTYNRNTRIFEIVVNYSGVEATAAHIHKGAVGVGGGVVFGFTAPVTSPINYTSPELTTSQDSALNANLYYVNIHSANFPAGEIRGQLIKQ